MKRAWAQLKHHPSRFGALLLAIMISVGFVTTSLVFIETESTSIRHQLAAPASKSDVVVSINRELAEDPNTRAVAAQLHKTPGVAVDTELHELYLQVNGSSTQAYSMVPEDLRWGKLKEGAWPAAADEIAVSADLAAEHGLKIGDTVEASFFGEDAQQATLRVTGIATNTGSLLSGVSLQAFVSTELAAKHPDSANRPLWLLNAAEGTSADQLVTAVSASLSSYGDDLVVQTSADYANELAKSVTGGVDIFRAILLVFGAIAMVVGMLIIANTFTILIAQRRRQIGLLRAIGSSSSQVQRGLLAEALLLGMVGSLLGIAAGIGLGAAAAAVTGSLASGLTVPWTVMISFGAGVLVTVLAAWLPSLRTTSIKPLEALRVAATDGARQRPGLATTIVSSLLVLSGSAVLAFAATSKSNVLVLAVGASALLALGVLLGAGWYVPLLVRAIGALPARLGATPRLAVANAVRNPKRTTATCLALMLAVGLVVTLQVGSASVKASAEHGITERYPVSLIMQTGGPGTMPSDLTERVRAIDGVAAATEVSLGEPEINGNQWLVLGVGAGLSDVVPGLTVGPRDLVLSPDVAKDQGWTAGQEVELTVGSRTETMTVHLSHVADGATAVVAEETLRRWAPTAAPSQVWASVTTRDSAVARSAMEEVQKLEPSMYLGGSLAFVTVLTQVLDVLLMIATGLLGAAVLIALIGVGNTLGLSVLERTRESALLRALGLQRSQLRATLAIEAVLLAVAGAVVGVIAGIGFGYVGTWAIMAEMQQTALLQVSAPMLLVDAAIAIVAGLLAAVLPARRAAMAAPTEALAEN